MRVRGLRLHVSQIDNGSVVSNESGGQSHQGVFHPKALHLRLFEHKQHALVLGHVLSVHQANGALLRSGCHLGVNLVHARLQHHPRKLGLRGLGCGIPAQQKKEKREHLVSHFEVSVDG